MKIKIKRMSIDTVVTSMFLQVLEVVTGPRTSLA